MTTCQQSEFCELESDAYTWVAHPRLQRHVQDDAGLKSRDLFDLFKDSFDVCSE